MRYVIAFLAACVWLLGTSSDAVAAERFRVFESFLFAPMPDLGPQGIEHLRIVYESELWQANVSHDVVPSDNVVRRAAAGGAGSGGELVLDIEGWTGPDAFQKFRTTLEKFRHAVPSAKLGIYSFMPVRDYWRAQTPGSPDYGAWKVQNDEAGQLVPFVDALYPSLYTFYPDQDGWVRYAEANLAEARRIAKGKPVYCFLWPQYHPSTANAYRFLPADYWRRELDTCHRLADGIVLWGGYVEDPDFRHLPWSDSAPWWRATVEFMKTVR